MSIFTAVSHRWRITVTCTRCQLRTFFTYTQLDVSIDFSQPSAHVPRGGMSVQRGVERAAGKANLLFVCIVCNCCCCCCVACRTSEWPHSNQCYLHPGIYSQLTSQPQQQHPAPIDRSLARETREVNWSRRDQKRHPSACSQRACVATTNHGDAHPSLPEGEVEEVGEGWGGEDIINCSYSCARQTIIP